VVTISVGTKCSGTKKLCTLASMFRRTVGIKSDVLTQYFRSCLKFSSVQRFHSCYMFRPWFYRPNIIWRTLQRTSSLLNIFCLPVPSRLVSSILLSNPVKPPYIHVPILRGETASLMCVNKIKIQVHRKWGAVNSTIFQHINFFMEDHVNSTCIRHPKTSLSYPIRKNKDTVF
jgi:hypothetical protein